MNHIVVKFRIGRSGTDHEQVNPFGSQLDPERLTEALQRKFARAVFVHPRNPPVSENRTNIHYNRAPPAQKGRKRFANQFCSSEKIHFHNPPESLRR